MTGSVSLPVRGAWIEISCRYRLILHRQSLPVRGAWIEILCKRVFRGVLWSLPVRGAWIEICRKAEPRQKRRVAPRAGSVD